MSQNIKLAIEQALDLLEIKSKNGGKMIRKNTKTLVMALLIIVILAGCATERIMKTTDETFPAKSSSNVKLYLSEKPSQTFTTIGSVSVDKFTMLGMSRSGDEINNLLKVNAASIGGDALIDIKEDFGSVSGVVVVFTGSTQSKKKVK